MGQSKAKERDGEKELLALRPKDEIFRVIDDCICVLTTLDPRKALMKLVEIQGKYESDCWAEIETLK